MKALCAVTAATLVLLCLAAVAQETKPAAPGPNIPKRISAAEAANHYQETAIVTGKVAQVTIRPKLVFVNLEQKYPQTPMSCVVFARATNQFGDLKRLEGKHVEVRGKIEDYQGKAQIVLTSTNQLKIIEPTGSANSAR
jgi:DNA/RNA endonuclease YhcR with UshA esterase domain